MDNVMDDDQLVLGVLEASEVRFRETLLSPHDLQTIQTYFTHPVTGSRMYVNDPARPHRTVDVVFERLGKLVRAYCTILIHGIPSATREAEWEDENHGQEMPF